MAKSEFGAWFRQQFGPAPKRLAGDLKEAIRRGEQAREELARLEAYEAARTAALYGWTAGYNASNKRRGKDKGE